MFRNKHRRSQSDFAGPGPFALVNLQSQKSPGLPGRPVASPTSSCQTDISHPQAVDPEKLEQFSRQRLSTMQMMFDEALREYDGLKQEYLRKPSETNYTNYETKAKVVRRLASQLSMYGDSPDAQSMEKRFCRRGSSIEGGFPAVDSDRDVSTRPPHPPTHYVPRHKGSDVGVVTTDTSKLSRSHSDSYKRIKKAAGDQLLFSASTDEIQKLAASGSSEYEIRQHPDSQRQTKSQETASDDSSDSALTYPAPTSENSLMFTSSVYDSSSEGSKHQSNIIALDDYEFGSDEDNISQYEDIGSPFNDFGLLEGRPAHLAVFLHYLISNSDAYPLLFYIVSGSSYYHGSLKEQRRWAYEIFSTFLVDKAPLKVKVDDSYLETILDVLFNKYDKEDAMQHLFTAVRDKVVLPQINELLADFRSKRALGLGGIYGDHELKDGLDHVAEQKVVENVLWKHFEHSADDDHERNLVLASALATYFKLVGCTNVRNSHMLERCPTFNTKDKSRFSVFTKKERGITHRNHTLLPQHYYVPTFCQLCHTVLFGVGNQGYQCQKCDQNFHKSCIEKIKELCTGKKSVRPTTVFDKLIKKQTIAAALESRMERTTSMPCVMEIGKSSLSSKPSFAGFSFWDKGRGKDAATKLMEKSELPNPVEEMKSVPPESSVTETWSNKQNQHDTAENVKLPPSYLSTINFSGPPYSSTSSDAPLSYLSLNISPAMDSDLDVELDLPPLEEVISKDYLKKLDKKEKKRQEVINELFHTEKTHLRDVKAMKQLFYVPLRNDPSLVELANFVFPCIKDIVEFHKNLNSEFKRLRSCSENGVVNDFAEVLLTYFSGEKGENFKFICGQFCEKQSQAQELLKARQRKEPKLAALLQAAASSSISRRLALKDFLPIPMQRLTKYPMLIENLIKYTQSDLEESVRLRHALECSRQILFSVNKTVNDYQNRQKLEEIWKKLDKRLIENSSHPMLVQYKDLDLTKHTLLFDGPLTWRISRDRMIPLHVVLLDSILLLLQKEDNRYVLRCESTLITAGKEDTKTTHSPILKLSKLMIRAVATDKCAFFLMSMSSDAGGQFYDLVASSKEEKNKWQKHITNAIGVDSSQVQSSKSIKQQFTPDNDVIYTSQELHHKNEGLNAIYDEEENFELQKQENEAVSLTVADCQIEDEPYYSQKSNTSTIITLGDPMDQLKQVDAVIQRLMCEKQNILSHLCAESLLISDEEHLEDSDVDGRLLVLSTLHETDQLMCLVNNQRLLNIHNTLEQNMTSSNTASASDSETDKSAAAGKDATTMTKGQAADSLMALPISQVTNLSNSIHKNLTHLLEYVIRNEEEKKTLIMDVQLAQEKLACLQLSTSDHQSLGLGELQPDLDLVHNEKEMTPAVTESVECNFTVPDITDTIDVDTKDNSDNTAAVLNMFAQDNFDETATDA